MNKVEQAHWESVLGFYLSLPFSNLEIRRGIRYAKNNLRRLSFGKHPITPEFEPPLAEPAT